MHATIFNKPIRAVNIEYQPKINTFLPTTLITYAFNIILKTIASFRHKNA
jgi:hypothetical protein